jgi:hypothetical protein
MPHELQTRITALPADKRFNNLSEDETLDRFEWFEIVPCRNDEHEGGTVQCEAGWAEFWGIYGRVNEGTDAAPEYLAYAVHDALNVQDAVRIARQVAIETGKGFVAGDTEHGKFPILSGRLSPQTNFQVIAEDITFAIITYFEEEVALEDRRDDDFENHPLAGLREALVEFSSYSGDDELDPYNSGVKMACSSCNSTDVRKDAYAEWDDNTQAWVMCAVYDNNWCVQCGAEQSLIEKPLTKLDCLNVTS